MNDYVDDIETEIVDLNGKTPQKVFEVFEMIMLGVEDQNDTIVRFYQNRFFMIQEDKKKITYFCINEYGKDEFKDIQNIISDFCINNNVEFRMVL